MQKRAQPLRGVPAGRGLPCHSQQQHQSDGKHLGGSQPHATVCTPLSSGSRWGWPWRWRHWKSFCPVMRPTLRQQLELYKAVSRPTLQTEVSIAVPMNNELAASQQTATLITICMMVMMVISLESPCVFFLLRACQCSLLELIPYGHPSAVIYHNYLSVATGL